MGDTTKITLGQCNVAAKPYRAGNYTSGYTSLGYITEKGGTYQYKGEELKVKSGNLLGIIKKMLLSEEASFEAALEEVTIENLATAFGLTEDDIIDDDVNHYKYIQFGGNTDTNYFSVKITSTLENGQTLTICLYKCQLARDQKIEISPSKIIETPVKFVALGDTNSGTLNKLGYISIV